MEEEKKEYEKPITTIEPVDMDVLMAGSGCANPNCNCPNGECNYCTEWIVTNPDTGEGYEKHYCK